jgi:DNA-binding response OmpR family regulator
MLTARVEESDRVAGLELGADDYVTKPFSPRELTARIRSALRRLDAQIAGAAAGILQADALRLDPIYRSVTLAGEAMDLTSKEFDLLHHFMRHPARPFSRDELLTVIQGDGLDDVAYERTIDVHIKNIRQKLGDSGRNSRFIETVHGVGYRFLPQVERM